MGMSPAVKTILERVARQPRTRRRLSETRPRLSRRGAPETAIALGEDERAAIQAARRGPLASDDEVEAFWKHRGLMTNLNWMPP